MFVGSARGNGIFLRGRGLDNEGPKRPKLHTFPSIRQEVLRWEGVNDAVLFHLKSKQTCISDDNGKEFGTLNEACEHGRNLVDKILQHVGYDDAHEWKVVV